AWASWRRTAFHPPRRSRPTSRPRTPHGPRNPVLLIYRTIGGTGLNGLAKTFPAGAPTRATDVPPASGVGEFGSAGDAAQGPSRRQGGEEAGTPARGLVLLDEVAGE